MLKESNVLETSRITELAYVSRQIRPVAVQTHVDVQELKEITAL